MKNEKLLTVNQQDLKLIRQALDTLVKSGGLNVAPPIVQLVQKMELQLSDTGQEGIKGKIKSEIDPPADAPYRTGD